MVVICIYVYFCKRGEDQSICPLAMHMRALYICFGCNGQRTQMGDHFTPRPASFFCIYWTPGPSCEQLIDSRGVFFEGAMRNCIRRTEKCLHFFLQAALRAGRNGTTRLGSARHGSARHIMYWHYISKNISAQRVSSSMSWQPYYLLSPSWQITFNSTCVLAHCVCVSRFLAFQLLSTQFCPIAPCISSGTSFDLDRNLSSVM